MENVRCTSFPNTLCTIVIGAKALELTFLALVYSIEEIVSIDKLNMRYVLGVC